MEASSTLLSIVLPCWNRHDLIVDCLRSIDVRERAAVQVVLVDDGSEPSLQSTVAPHLESGDRFLRQANRGRAVALREGILAATGRFLMVMDSDDEFIAGRLDDVLAQLRAGTTDGCLGLVYEAVDFETGEPISRLPEGTVATLLGLRADLGITGDLKEIVRTDAVKASLYPDPHPERRVPTSYIWAGVSAMGAVRTRALALVRHRYLPGGMTRTIAKLKRDNPVWLARTHLLAATAPVASYRSRRFRWTKAIKALAVGEKTLVDAERRRLKLALGTPMYHLCRIAARLSKSGGLT